MLDPGRVQSPCPPERPNLPPVRPARRHDAEEARLLPVSIGPQRASSDRLTRHSGWVILLAILVAITMAATVPTAPPAAAATGPKVAIIVGPGGSSTATFRRLADEAAAEASRYTSNVVRVYSPNATWSRVKAAIRGAAVVVYLGRGRGYPSPGYSTLVRATLDGFGLNPVAGGDNTTTKFYGENYVRAVPLAPNAVVLLSHVRYAPGYGESGRPQPTRSVARRRVDNYAAGFLAAGASAVIAEATGSPVYYIRAIFTRTMTLDAMWRAAPSRNGHVSSFHSTRTTGAIARLDPVHATSSYYRSIAGRLATSTAKVRVAIASATTAPPPRSAGRVSVPSSIDATGSTNVASALISFVNSVPDGSTIVFKKGGVYRLNAALKFAHRHNLTLEGNGATLKGVGGTTEASSLLWLGSFGGGNTGIVIRNFILAGNSTTPGVYKGGKEGAHGILIDGGSGIEISGVTVRGVWGDCLYIGSSATAVSFHDSNCASNGRNGVTVTSGTNVTVQRVAFPKSGYCTLDVEPNVRSEAARSIRFLDNTAGTWTNSFVSAEGAPGSVVNGVTISGNTVTGKSLLTVIGLARRANIVFTNNTSKVKAAGPVLRFAHIDGLTVTGNVQPLSSGVLASITDSTNVTYP